MRSATHNIIKRPMNARNSVRSPALTMQVNKGRPRTPQLRLSGKVVVLALPRKKNKIVYPHFSVTHSAQMSQSRPVSFTGFRSPSFLPGIGKPNPTSFRSEGCQFAQKIRSILCTALSLHLKCHQTHQSRCGAENQRRVKEAIGGIR